jgi:hypothetical protein
LVGAGETIEDELAVSYGYGGGSSCPAHTQHQEKNEDEEEMPRLQNKARMMIHMLIR